MNEKNLTDAMASPEAPPVGAPTSHRGESRTRAPAWRRAALPHPSTPAPANDASGRRVLPGPQAPDHDFQRERPFPRAGPHHLTIAVDFDGVLFDHVPYLLRGFRDAHGIDLEEEGLRFWDCFQYRAVRERNLTWRCVQSVLTSIETDATLHRLPPRDRDCARVMRAWRREGHTVKVVTARPESSRETTELFLRENRIPHDALVMGAARKTGYDVLVDDAPHNVLMAAADGGLACLMDQPYNQDVPTRMNPIRVRSFADVAAALDLRAQHAAEQPEAAA